MINLNTVIVHADTEQNYVYESIKVMPNDSVWSLAKKYCPKDIDIKEYIGRPVGRITCSTIWPERVRSYSAGVAET